MENFGEKPHAKDARDPLFGTDYLRMDMDLEPNMVVTIEPGCILSCYLCGPTLYATFKHGRWDVLELERFGGIRIEDDIRCTTDKTHCHDSKTSG